MQEKQMTAVDNIPPELQRQQVEDRFVTEVVERVGISYDEAVKALASTLVFGECISYANPDGSHSHHFGFHMKTPPQQTQRKE